MRSQLAAALLALSTAAASAELPLSADSAARLARAQNPDLLAARSLVAEAQARSRSTGRLANPDLDFEIAGGQDAEGRVSIGLTQRFPLTSRLRLERKLSTFDIESARLEVQEKERQLALATRLAFYELAAIRESLALSQRQSAAARAFAASLERSAAEGHSSSLDAAQASLTADTLDAARESLRADDAIAAGRLASLLGLPADTAFAIKPQPLPSVLPANRTPAFRPDLRLAEMAVQSGITGVSLARASRWDDIGVGLFAEGERFRDEPEGIEPEALLGLRLTVPLPIWQNGSGRIAEQQAAQRRREQQLAALRLAAVNQALTAHRVMAALHRAALQTDAKLLPAARRQLTAAESAYQRGEIDQPALTRIRERLADLESTALDSRKKFHLAHSEWLAAIGDLYQ